jgi:pimeloyl-ACP methyl ester carboxylesterase
MAAPSDILDFTSAPGVHLVLDLHDGGDGVALPVLLLHGLSQQRRFWGPVVDRLRTRPVATLDQRGHGDSDTPASADFSVAACASDALAALDRLGWPRAVIAGHSWGASVALRAAALQPDRVGAVALIDGGLWSPGSLGPRDEVRARLTPPTLGLLPEDLWQRIRSGDMGASWSDEIQAALEPTFVADNEGRLHSRLGLERHMRVLDGLLDVDPGVDVAALESADVPVWAVVCEPRPRSESDPWDDVKSRAVAQASARRNFLIHRWAGAIHDVPLQWPGLVAGFIDTVAASAE